MNSNLKFFTTCKIWLVGLEDFYNNGLDEKKVKEIIESMRNPTDPRGWNFIFDPCGIVEVFSLEPNEINNVVNVIDCRLRWELAKLKYE